MSHARGLSSIDASNVDVEGGPGARLDDDYFAGLPIFSAFQEARLPWTSVGPSSFQRSNVAEAWEGGNSLTDQAQKLGLTIGMQLGWAKAGFVDSTRMREVANVIISAPAVGISIFKGLALTTVVTLLIFFFELAFFPSQLYLSSSDAQGESDTSSGGNVLWLYPVVAVSYFMASSWTADVAVKASRVKHGRGMSLAVVASAGTRRRILQESFRILLVANYFAVVLALQFIPYLRRPLTFTFMSFIDAMYCFDPVLASRGWPLERRLRYVESRWAYMLAFGIWPTLVSFFHPSGLLNLFLFMLIYPFCTVLALLASPQPRTIPGASATVITPLSSSTGKRGNMSSGDGSSHLFARNLSPFVPMRIPIFMPTVVIYRLLMRYAPAASEFAEVNAARMWSGDAKKRDVPGNGNGNGNGSGSGSGSGYPGYGGFSMVNGNSNINGSNGSSQGYGYGYGYSMTSSNSGQGFPACGYGGGGAAAATAPPGQGNRSAAAQFVGGVWGSQAGSLPRFGTPPNSHRGGPPPRRGGGVDTPPRGSVAADGNTGLPTAPVPAAPPGPPPPIQIAGGPKNAGKNAEPTSPIRTRHVHVPLSGPNPGPASESASTTSTSTISGGGGGGSQAAPPPASMGQVAGQDLTYTPGAAGSGVASQSAVKVGPPPMNRKGKKAD